ncbi:plasmid transfer ATPase TraJ, partial [Escherichia coli]
MNIPDEFGLFPFQRFTADELRHFFVWCAAHKVSDVDLTGGSPHTNPRPLLQTIASSRFGSMFMERMSGISVGMTRMVIDIAF